MAVDQEVRAAKLFTAPAKRATRTRPALRNSLLALLEQKPFEQITVREIAATARINYATFFRQYVDKDALLHDVAAHEIRDLLSLTLPMLSAAESRTSVQALCAYVWQHRKLWSALLTGGAAATLKEEFVRQAQEIAAAEPDHNSWFPGDLSVVFGVSATIEILAWWLKQSEPPSVDRMAEVLDRAVVAPNLAPPDQITPRRA